MLLRFIGKQGAKDVFVTHHAEIRFKQRNLTYKEALIALENRDVTYPKDEDGKEKLRSTVGSKKKVFLTIIEEKERVVIITGGESDASA